MAEVSSFGIQIKDVKKNEFTLTGDLESMKSGSRIYCDDDNNLIWTYSESMSESGTSIRMESTIKFTRTSTNTANGKMTGSAKVSMTGGSSFDMGFNGNFLGTLVTDDSGL